MPIRFRCASCNQLLGIARRKAGTIVHCPTCNSAVTVPMASQEDVPSPEPPAAIPEPEPAPAPAAPALLERSDFEDYLHDAVPAPPPAPAPAPRPATNPFDLGQLQAVPVPPPLPPPRPAPAPDGIVLSPARATVLTVAMILLLAVAFGAGLVIGRWLL
jgi:hypothetical protein